MKHLFIPDCQVKPGVMTDHLEACGNFIVDKKPEKIIIAGDFWDFPSLSVFDKPGSKNREGLRYAEDLQAGVTAFRRLMDPIQEYNRKARKSKQSQYVPEVYFTEGNHEYRIQRAIQSDPIHLEGVISTHDYVNILRSYDVHWSPYKEIINLDGILYSHLFVNQESLMKNVIGGTITNKLQKVGHSFTMGHQQVKQSGQITTSTGEVRRGLVAGAFYMHDEGYLGPQGNLYWRGVIMKHEVRDGNYDLMEVSIRYLLENYL